MKQATTKTTVRIDPHLLYLAKLKALNENTTLKAIINDSLVQSLKTSQPRKKMKGQIGGHKLGNIKGNLSRTEIYDHL